MENRQMRSKTLTLCAALVFGVACNISDPMENNANTTNNTPQLDMTADLAQPDMAPGDMDTAPDLPAEDMALDMGPDQAPDMEVDMGPPTIPLDQLKQAYIDALSRSYCGLIWDCPHPPPNLLSDFGSSADKAECLSSRLFSVLFGAQLDRLIDSVNAGRITYDPAAAARCLGPLLDAPSQPSFCDKAVIFEGNSPDCKLVFRGNVQEGGDCTSSDECAPSTHDGSAYCEMARGACYGKCVTTSSNNICGQTTCAESEYCHNGVGFQSCKPKGQLGEQCAQYNACLGDNAYCAYTPSGDGICVQRRSVAAGGACLDHAQCVNGARCSGGLCAYPSLLGQGETCGNADAVCKPGLACALVDTRSGRRECKPPGNVGARCYDHYECGVNLYCGGFDTSTVPPTVGTCYRPKSEGKNCEQDLECASYYCRAITPDVANVCTKPVACMIPR
jgi:hypothetical protein